MKHLGVNVSVSHLQIVKAVSVSIMIDDYEDQFKKKWSG